MVSNIDREVSSAASVCVIVPVYKVEPYLHACIDSILNQTFQNFELLLIDDGSPDRCGAICDEYAKKDSRVVVIHQENGGLSAARNRGIDWFFSNSGCEWITFVDSDDLLAPTAFEHLFRYARAYSADIVTTQSTVFTDEAQLSHAPHHVVSAHKRTGPEACRSIYKRDYQVPVTLWGKLIRRDLLENVRCPVGKIHEDDAVTPCLLHSANTVVVLSAWLYFNRTRQGSIINSAFSIKSFDRIEAIESCISFFEKKQDHETVEMARKFRDEVCATTVLRAWKHRMVAQIPDRYKMSLVKAVYLTVKDSVCRGDLTFIADRIKKFFA